MVGTNGRQQEDPPLLFSNDMYSASFEYRSVNGNRVISLDIECSDPMWSTDTEGNQRFVYEREPPYFHPIGVVENQDENSPVWREINVRLDNFFGLNVNEDMKVCIRQLIVNTYLENASIFSEDD